MTPTETLRGLLERATKGDWEVNPDQIIRSGETWIGAFLCGISDRQPYAKGHEATANADLIALAPALAQEVLDLRAENERLREAIQVFIDAAPLGLDDKPYCSDVMQSEFKELARALTRKE